MFRSALLILSGNAAASLLLLARNLIIARLISVEDYGVAATFAIAMAVVEMMSALGLQQQIVQSKDGDDPRFQAGLQGFQVLRGVIAAAILFLSAGAIADFLNIPDVAWAYQVMALVPLFNALQHFDIHRLNRQMRFWPVVLTGAVPALISLLAVWPLYLWFGDYRVMLWSIILQIGLMLVVSHLVAERPYRLVFDRKIMAGSLRFGWPLLINGILLFAVFNGDKLIVGRVMGMETLAIFAMGITLTLTPTLVMTKSAQNFFLPQLSQIDRSHQEQELRFQQMATIVLQGHLLLGVFLIGLMYAVTQPLIYFLLGPKYYSTIDILSLLAVIQSIRMFKGGSSTLALARGKTKIPLIGNLFRLITLPIAWWFAVETNSIMSVIWVAVVSEIFGYGVSLVLIRSTLGISLRKIAVPVVLAIGGLAAVALHAATGHMTAVIGASVAFIVATASMGGLFSSLKSRLLA